MLMFNLIIYAIYLALSGLQSAVSAVSFSESRDLVWARLYLIIVQIALQGLAGFGQNQPSVVGLGSGLLSHYNLPSSSSRCQATTHYTPPTH